VAKALGYVGAFIAGALFVFVLMHSAALRTTAAYERKLNDSTAAYGQAIARLGDTASALARTAAANKQLREQLDASKATADAASKQSAGLGVTISSSASLGGKIASGIEGDIQLAAELNRLIQDGKKSVNRLPVTSK